MALLVSAADGNFTTAATWGAAETGTGAQLTNPSASTNTTTSYVYSSTFTGTNLNVCDGIALFCKRVNTTGTVSVALSDDNGTTATRSVTVNASDLPADEAWVFFKFGSTLTLDGGTDYRVGITGSSAGNATFYRDATAGNWARVLRLTAAPGSVAAADTFLIAGEWTAAGASTARTITMNSTAATDYGSGTATATAPTQTNTQAFTGLQIGQLGTLTWAASAATNYILRLSGNLVVWSGGTYNQGTTGTPCPRDSTMTLEFDCAADGDHGFLAMNGSTVNIQGLSRTSGKNIYWTLLNTDEAANSTSLGVADDTGWLDNDIIAVATTSRTSTECEVGTLNGAAGASTLTVDGFAGSGGGLAFAHSGTSPTQAAVVLLTRNVKVRAVTSTAVTYCFFGTTATADLDWCEFRYIGDAVASKRGIHIATTTGSFNMQYCSVYDTEDNGIFVDGATTNNFTIKHCVAARVASVGQSFCTIPATTNSTWELSNCVFMWAQTNVSMYTISSLLGTIANLRAHGSGGNGITYAAAGSANAVISGLNVNGCARGITGGANIFGADITDSIIWRNTFAAIESGSLTRFIDCQFFGNASRNYYSTAGSYVEFDTCSFNGDSSFSTTNNLSLDFSCHVHLESCSLSAASGILTAATNDIIITASAPVIAELDNCIMAASTEVSTQSSLITNSYVSSSKHDQTAGAHKTWKRGGTIERDTTIFNTAAPSERLTPISASVKLIGSSRLVAVDNAATKTISVYVRKSVIGDGAAYNGNQPRLILKRNDAVGITSDTVLDTASGAAGSWEQLTGTTSAATDDGAFEVYVDCDGTAGWVNVDDWSVT